MYLKGPAVGAFNARSCCLYSTDYYSEEEREKNDRNWKHSRDGDAEEEAALKGSISNYKN